MGSSDSSCCGSHSPRYKADMDAKQMQKNRMKHHVKQSHQVEGKVNHSELYPDPLIDKLKSYHQRSLDLNKKYQHQSEQLALSFIDELKENKIIEHKNETWMETTPKPKGFSNESTKTPRKR